MTESARALSTPPDPDSELRARCVSVVIPAHNEASSIGELVPAVHAQIAPCAEIEVIVVDDASTDATAVVAADAGAHVIKARKRGNPAAARNQGAAAASGDPLVFLDADCMPAPGWLSALLRVHERGETIVGGALNLAEGLTFTARCDYYSGWYHVHSRRRPGYVPNHPPGNLSIRRDAFLSTKGFDERHPVAFAHEELGWQAELAGRGHRIYFQPEAVVYHRNRPGFGNLLRRNYRWAYSAVESKAATRAARMAWLYRYPRVIVALGPPFAIAQTGYILSCWLRAGIWEPLLMLPAVLSARIAYVAGMMVGTLRWLRSRDLEPMEVRPRWE